jgi:hypothetical protein
MWEFNMILINWHLWSHSRLGSAHKSSQVCWQIQSLSRQALHDISTTYYDNVHSLSVNSVLFAVIMIAHCIQSLRQRYEWENFDGLRVLSKFCVDDESKKNHTNSLHLQATWRRIKNTWFSQFKDQQNAILKILLLHVTQQISRDNIEAAIDINSVANSYINTLNNLSIAKMHNSSTLKTSSFIESTWMLLSSFNWFFDNLLSTDSRKHKEITSP